LAASNSAGEALALVLTRVIWLSIFRVMAQATTFRTNGLDAE